MSEPKVCERCGASFTKPPLISAGQWQRRRYCSPACASKPDRYGNPNERFWAQVREPRDFAPGACFEWIGSLATNGYGRFWEGGRAVQAHRFAWQTVNGSIPDGLLVLHHCDNRQCVRPSHLFLGTYADNMADMDAKGRRHNNPLRGERHVMARLTAADVENIRARAAAGELNRSIALRYGITRNHATRIVNGRRWAIAALRRSGGAG